MIEKIEQTLDVVIPFLILVLSVFQLTGVIEIGQRNRERGSDTKLPGVPGETVNAGKG
jgi:hypothetical protein